MKENQNGRSMIEMLGVLAVVGVLSVGGLSVFTKAQNEHKLSQLVVDVTNMATIAKKMACKYDDGYSNYNKFMGKSKKIPADWKYDKDDATEFTANTGEVVEFTYTQGSKTAEGKYISSKLEVEISNLKKQACIKLASNDYGKRRNTGLLGLNVNSASSSSYHADTTKKEYPMTISTAVSKCDKEENTIYLFYKGCN